LSISYELKGRFFPGPKRALAELSPLLKDRWTRALEPDAPMRELENLVAAVVGPP
jgi:hypothetical protein